MPVHHTSGAVKYWRKYFYCIKSYKRQVTVYWCICWPKRHNVQHLLETLKTNRSILYSKCIYMPVEWIMAIEYNCQSGLWNGMKNVKGSFMLHGCPTSADKLSQVVCHHILHCCTNIRCLYVLLVFQFLTAKMRCIAEFITLIVSLSRFLFFP